MESWNRLWAPANGGLNDPFVGPNKDEDRAEANCGSSAPPWSVVMPVFWPGLQENTALVLRPLLSSHMIVPISNLGCSGYPI